MTKREMKTRFETPLPSSVLRRWIEKNQDKVYAVSYEGGYAFTGSNDRAYDLLLHPGWVTTDGMHTIIEPNAKTVLAVLRSISPCDCQQCQDRFHREAK